MKYFIVLLVLVQGSLGLAQRPDFESLKSAIQEAKSEESRLRALTEYGNALPNNRHQEILRLADSISLLVDESSSPELANATSQFLRGISHFKGQDYFKAKSYLKFSAAYFHQTDDELEFITLNTLGLTYIRLRELDSAIYLYNRMLRDLPDDNLRGRISAHGNLGSVYRQSGNYAKAITHLETVYQLDSSNAFTRINTVLNIAHIYNDMELFDRAIHTLKAFDISSVPPIPPKSVYYNNLANSYLKSGQLDSGLIFIKQGLEVARQINYPQGEFTALSNLIECRMELQQYDSIPKLFTALEQKADARRIDAPMRVNFLKGNYYLKTGQFEKSINSFLIAEKAADLPQLQGLKPAIFNGLIDAYNARDNTVMAKSYIEKLDQYRESPSNSQRERFLAEAKANYLLAETEQALIDKNEELVFFSSQRVLFGVATLMLLLLAIVLIKLNRRSTKTLESTEQINVGLQKEIEKQRTQIVELKSKAILDAQEIISIKSDGHYLEFSLKNKHKPEVDRNKLKDILEVLPDFFIQIHRSYIINLKEVRVKYADRVQMKNGDELPVSRKFKDEFNQALSQFNI